MRRTLFFLFMVLGCACLIQADEESRTEVYEQLANTECRQYPDLGPKQKEKHDHKLTGVGLVPAPDNESVAYRWFARNLNAAVTYGEQVGPILDRIQEDPIFSPDGEHLAYRAKEAGQWQVYLDGEKIGDHSFVGPLRWTGDSRLVYRANDGGKINDRGKGEGGTWRVFFGDEESEEYPAVTDPTASASGSRVAWVVTQATETVYVVIDGDEFGPFNRVAGNVDFTPDGERFTCQIWDKSNRAKFLTESGVVNRVGGAGTMILSPTSDATAWVRRIAPDAWVEVDGAEGPRFKNCGDPVFSPDGKTVGYWATRQDDTWTIVIGTEELGDVDRRADLITYFPESEKALCRYRTSANETVEITGTERETFKRGIRLGPPAFSPDGEHVAYTTTEGGWRIRVDGRLLPTFRAVSSPRFLDDDQLCYFAWDGKKVFRIVESVD